MASASEGLRRIPRWPAPRAVYLSKMASDSEGLRPSPGGIGVLYGEGCEVAVMFKPAFGDPSPQFTIAGNQISVTRARGAFEAAA